VRRKAKFVLAFGLIALLLFVNNFKEQREEYRLVKGTDQYLRRVVAAMEETGKKYWRGEYWSAYLLSALSAERLIVDSFTQNRYFPYKLDYFNQGENNNFVFLRGDGYEMNVSQRLAEVLDAVGLEYQAIAIGDSRLLFDVGNTVLPPALKSPPPPIHPVFELEGIDSSTGFLRLRLLNKEPVQGLHLRIHAEIPSFSSVARAVSWEREEVLVNIPFPDKPSFRVRYYLEYNSLKIPSSEREILYSPQKGDAERRKGQAIVPLSGFGPVVDFQGKKLQVCQKEASVEVNALVQEGTLLVLVLYSPFEFEESFWYGEYSQEAQILLNGTVLAERKLSDGENRIEIPLGGIPLETESNIVRMSFKYHLPFDFAVRWKTAALLDRIEIQ